MCSRVNVRIPKGTQKESEETRMKTQTIGIEIEMTGITRRAAAKAVANYFNTRPIYQGGAYETFEIEDNGGRIWSIKRDSSIRPEKKDADSNIVMASDDYKVEFITPILTYSDIENLQELVGEIRKAGGFVNKSCGMHVHIGATDFTAQAATNLLNAVASKQDLIYKALKVYPCREEYCHKIGADLLNDLREEKPKTLEKLASVWYNEPEREAVRNHGHYHSSRYHLVNLHALFTKGTVEFRMFNSTLHEGEVKAAIQFCLALMHQAKTTKKAIYRPTETDNDKYTFRCWLLRLGLNGEEFKTCRYHLLRNLEGNAAWRNAQTA